MASRLERAFRIADRRHPLFDGTGAFLHASESFSGALLEVLVHARIGKLPRNHSWIEIAIPATVSIEHLHAAHLPGWDHPESPAARAFGDQWLARKRTLILTVPSLAASGLGRNVLINQDQPHFRLLKASNPKPVLPDLGHPIADLSFDSAIVDY